MFDAPPQRSLRPAAEVIVVGGGPAGLATAACLKAAGIDALVLEAGSRIGERWRSHYDRLRLHTARRLSGLPGTPLPADAGRWVSRDDVAGYLEDYARLHALDVRTEVPVASVRRRDGGDWLVTTGSGDVRSAAVVVATGLNRRPMLPSWRGRERFRGQLVHSSQYRAPAPFHGRSVLVVGSGNSGGEIAVDLIEGGARRVLLSVRTPPNIIPREVVGLPIQYLGVAVGHVPTRLGDALGRVVQRHFLPDLTFRGLPRPDRGVATQFAADETTPMLDVGLAEAVRRGAVEVVAAVEGFGDDHVELADGTRVTVDAVIAATGYRAELGELVGGLEVLDGHGLPPAHGTPMREAPGLYFVGFRSPIGGQLREIGLEARRTAASIAARMPGRSLPSSRERRRRGPPPPMTPPRTHLEDRPGRSQRRRGPTDDRRA